MQMTGDLSLAEVGWWKFTITLSRDPLGVGQRPPAQMTNAHRLHTAQPVSAQSSPQLYVISNLSDLPADHADQAVWPDAFFARPRYHQAGRGSQPRLW